MTACSGSSSRGSLATLCRASCTVNKRRDSCKVLVWDGTGLCIFQNRFSSCACLILATSSASDTERADGGRRRHA